jgi:pyrroline-5-carboxylate reductase
MQSLAGLDIGFIGAGNMAEAMVRALLRAGVPSDRLRACDPAAARREVFHAIGIETTETSDQWSRETDLTVLAVKPQMITAALTGRVPGRSFCSIAAGVRISTLGQLLSGEGKYPDRPIVRAMPNTPLMVGCGATAIAPGPGVDATTIDRVRAVFECSGVCVVVEESQIDAVTALSGSGPAYFFLLTELMIRAGEALGLSRKVSETLAIQTACGAGRMLGESGLDPVELRRRVTSPGGTTQAAIQSFEASQLDRIVTDALRAARDRGIELAGR